MDIKKLKELYDQYKKIKGYDVGGEVQDVKSEDPSENEVKQMNPESQAFYKAKQKYGRETSVGLQHKGDKGETEGIPSYADGGTVDKDGNNAPISQDLIDAFKRTFSSSPKPSPSPTQKDDDSLQSKYDKIRQQNRSNFGYADGGEVQDPRLNTKTQDLSGQQQDTSDEHNEGQDPDAKEKQIKALAKQLGYADGGEVESPGLSPEEFQQHLKDLQDKGYHLQDVSGDDQTITVKPQSSVDQEEPASEEDVSPESPDDKSVEDQMQNEELQGQMEADKGEEAKPEEPSQEAPKDESPTEDKQQPEPDQESFSRLLASVKPEAAQGSNPLADAQKQRDLNLAYNQIERGSAIAGAGMAGRANVNPGQVLDAIKDREKYAGMPVQKYNELVANQQNDASSDMSKVVRDYMSSKGLQIPPSASAADLFKVAPFLQKDQALQQQMQKVLLQTQSREKVASSNQTAMDKRAADRNKIEQQKADAARENAQGNKEQKLEVAKDKTLAQTKQMLESARGNPAAAQAEKDLYAVDKVNSLLKIYPDPNKMPEAQVNLLISEVGKIATGGVPTGHEIDALKPGSAEGRLQKLWGQLTNQPTPANAAAYLKEFKKYNNALSSDAQKVLKDKYGRVIESSKKQLGDENYKALQDQYLNRFNKSEAPAVDADLTKMSPDQLKAYIKAHGGQ